ncbi:unnamed protein product [Cyprideis torosa]|uniref:non-specific serine/threonine protein kinase n=1 Tax=Cyprideis torosa TaxID=163714 RepID=A0A7R8WCK1_9CRUS|nr:unnamed protein product [Cyprideis torosa]CAG0892136.1 unnamed protein product [Cyprideis torosa]
MSSESAASVVNAAGDTHPFKQGAEARLYRGSFFSRPCIVKERFPKAYRHPELDNLLTKERIKAEVRALTKCREIDVPTPLVYFLDLINSRIVMEDLVGCVTVRDYIYQVEKEAASLSSDEMSEVIQCLGRRIGKVLKKLHENNIIHGDLTTSNMLLRQLPNLKESELVMIDFGLSSTGSATPEDMGVDLYVLERAILSTHPKMEELFQRILESYDPPKAVKEKFEEVRARGRKRTMVG